MTDASKDVLARTVYGEARGEGYGGMLAVAFTVTNRVKHPTWWGHDVISVCKKPKQYSCWNENDPNLEVITHVTTSDSVFLDAICAASDAMADTMPDPTLGATHYYDVRMKQPPYWAKDKTPLTRIGHHIFFNLGGGEDVTTTSSSDPHGGQPAREIYTGSSSETERA